MWGNVGSTGNVGIANFYMFDIKNIKTMQVPHWFGIDSQLPGKVNTTHINRN